MQKMLPLTAVKYENRNPTYLSSDKNINFLEMVNQIKNIKTNLSQSKKYLLTCFRTKTQN